MFDLQIAVTLALINALAALALQMVMGYPRVYSLAHGALCGVGAYAAAITLRFLVSSGDLPLLAGPLALIAAAVTGALCAAMIALPLRMLDGDDFLMASVVIAIVLEEFARHSRVVGGTLGLHQIPQPTLLQGWPLAFVSLSIVALSLVVARYAAASKFGLSLAASAHDESLGWTAGELRFSLRIRLMMLSGGIAALSGGLAAIFVGFIEPATFSLQYGILLFVAVIAGGRESAPGAVLGAVILTTIPIMLQWAGANTATQAHIRELSYGLILLAFARFRPTGLCRPDVV